MAEKAGECMNKMAPRGRTYGEYLMPKPKDTIYPPSPIVTRKFDVAHYEATGEIIYTDVASEESTMTYQETQAQGKIKAAIMRQEIQTLEDFKAVGSTRAVAKKYGVAASTAQWYKSYLVRKDEKAMTELTETEPKEESTQDSEVAYLAELLIKATLVSVREHIQEQTEDMFAKLLVQAQKEGHDAEKTSAKVYSLLRVETLQNIKDDILRIVQGQ